MIRARTFEGGLGDTLEAVNEPAASRQTDVWDLLPANFIETHCTSPGGRFGPVGDDGYGISYMAVNSVLLPHLFKDIIQ